MNVREVGSAALAGLAASVAAFVAVTEILSSTVEFSVFLGLPAGVFVGVVAAAVVLLSYRGRSPTLARALVGFAVAFLVGFAALVLGTGFGVIAALVVGVVAGVIGALAVFVRAWSVSS
ncbi:hypothetical protein [Halobellus captivus]|uniref:hypothetical protein n=1 Tax=Halobellus captivus TaxID=2592614 RepID=UPI0011AB18C1|nr:hypothetical protein [Halobellus captivus]